MRIESGRVAVVTGGADGIGFALAAAAAAHGMRVVLAALLVLSAGVALAQAPAGESKAGQNDCGCAGDADCLLFCAKRTVATPGSIGSKIGNKDIGLQKRIETLDAIKALK